MTYTIEKIIVETPIFEDSKTLELLEYFNSIKKQGFFNFRTRIENLKMEISKTIKILY